MALLALIVIVFLYMLFVGRSINIGTFTLESSLSGGVIIRTVKKKDRQKLSGQLVESAQHEVHVFGGDLSWLVTDLSHFAKILKEGKKVKIIADNPDQSTIDTLLSWNIELRKYSDDMQAPIKGYLIDPSRVKEGECRAVTIRKKRNSMGGNPDTIYEFAEYRSNMHSEVVYGMASWFDILFEKGKEFKKNDQH